MPTTPQAVITDALFILNVGFPGQTPSPSMLADGLARLNYMLASWSIERLIVYGILRNTYPLTAGVNAYTIGAGGGFNTTRPTSIHAANIVIASLSIRSQLKLADTQEWAQIADQTASSTTPSLLYNDYEYPVSNLLLWPTPNANATQLELYTWQQLEQFSSLTDSFDMPPGYQIAVTYNLAMILSMVYGRPMAQEAIQTAMTYKDSLKGINAPPTHLSGAGEEAISKAQVLQQTGGLPPGPNPMRP